MNIINVNLSKRFRGREQVYLDLAQVIFESSYKLTSVLHKKSFLENSAQGDIYYLSKNRWSASGLINRFKLRKEIVSKHLFITHSSTWLKSIQSQFNSPFTLVVSHDYSIKSKISAKYMVTVSEHMRNYFIAHGFNKRNIFTINPCISTSIIRKKDEGEFFVVGAIGYFSTEKGFDTLLRVLQVILDKKNNVHLTIAGYGPEQGKLKKLSRKLGVDKNIDWLGWLPVQEQEKFWQCIDLLCVPSNKESFGLVILEALSRGIPVVATDNPGPSTILRDGINGFLVPNNPKVIANKILSLIDAPMKRKEISLAGYERSKDFSYSKFKSDWLEVLGKITKWEY